MVILALSVLQGFETSISEKIVNLNAHLKVTGFSNRNLPGYKEIIPELKKDFNQIESVSPFTSKLAIIKHKRLSEGISLIGIDTLNDNSNLRRYIIEGKFSTGISGELHGVIIGKRLAEKLFIKIGDDITIFSIKNDNIPSPENPPAISKFKVTGIYESGMSEYDDLFAYTDLKFTQSFFGMNNKISGYNIKLKDISKIESMEIKLQDYFRYPYYVRSIYRIHQNIFTWIDLQKEPIPIVLGLIILVAVFNIIGTILIIVLEKTGAIGILRSLGATRSTILKIFLTQGTIVSVVGIILGNVLAFLLSILQVNFNIISLPGTVYFVTSVPLVIEPIHYLIVSSVTLILAFFSSLIPSYIAANIKTVNAIKFQ
ncbi:MAG: ABC transporter permease [Melioribacteraceae bacterium]|nr:ABC transporter permease [Melioribacteraceae bacterium]